MRNGSTETPFTPRTNYCHKRPTSGEHMLRASSSTPSQQGKAKGRLRSRSDDPHLYLSALAGQCCSSKLCVFLRVVAVKEGYVTYEYAGSL